MKSIKVIFIAAEVAMLIGVVLFSFLTDWEEVESQGSSWTFRLIIVLMSICAVAFQKEQQSIEWDEES